MSSDHIMDTEVERLSVELLDELASNERRTVDPRTVDLRFTHLKAFAQSAAHALHTMTRSDDSQTASTRTGSGSHALSLGGAEVAVFAGKVRRGKEWDAFRADNAGKVILNPAEFARVRGVSDAIRRNKVAERLLFSEGTVREQRIDWEWNGRKCRSTPDARSLRTLIELKSCRSSSPEQFRRDALRYAYPSQLAFYRRAIEQATGVRPREVYIIAVEQAAPYAVTPFQLTERALEAGDRLVKGWFEQLRVCEATGMWPEYTLGIEEFDVIDFDAEAAIAMRDDDGTRSDVAF